MVLYSDKKYACETCIKGHRSSACQHTDRPLFEIKKKGRPVTQCEHCRELRKTKQVHVKCSCQTKQQDDQLHPSPGMLSGKKGAHMTSEIPAFPKGLPKSVESPAEPSTSSHPLPSESDHIGDISPCKCDTTGECHCCTPRKSAPRRRFSRNGFRPTGPDDAAPESRLSVDSPEVLARMAQLRPVLPRPPTQAGGGLGPVHDPSSGIAHKYGARHRIHENMLFSPYGRAYGQFHHSAEDVLHGQRMDSQTAEIPSQLLSKEEYFQFLTSTPISDDFSQTLWNGMSWSPAQTNFPSACGCLDACVCSGCVEHKPVLSPVSAPSSSQSCLDPIACLGIDGSMLSQTSPPSQYSAESLDEWVRQLNSGLDSTNSQPPQLNGDMQSSAFINVTPEIYQSFVEPFRPPQQQQLTERRCEHPPGQCSPFEGSCDYVYIQRSGSGDGSSMIMPTAGGTDFMRVPVGIYPGMQDGLVQAVPQLLRSRSSSTSSRASLGSQLSQTSSSSSSASFRLPDSAMFQQQGDASWLGGVGFDSMRVEHVRA